ncbi:MAG: U32 family peptidase [Candidatus Delongbacteria bacterium]|nr:U32 family peptidase [Candidatus Delongbacteria bacterium]
MELMSPAGNYSSFKAAIKSGADAVYMGLSLFNARRPAKNFGFTELEEIIHEAHENNTKVYITLNIDLKSNELTDAVKILLLLVKVKVDAVIVKDTAVIYLINKYFPELEIHLSTQFGIANSKAMTAAGKLLKAQRVVLARELNFNELKALNNDDYPEREIFIQGSMCYSFSGRCLMSSWNGGRSANRGACQAPCRFLYKKNDENIPESYFSMKDLSLADKIDVLNELNISALKIEGRLKSSDWVGEITSIYRAILDHSTEPDLDVLQKFSGRELAHGFYGGLDDLTSEQKIKQGQFSDNKTGDTSVGKGKYDLSIMLQNNKIIINIFSDYGNIIVTVPHKWIIKENRAIYFSELEQRISNTSFGGLFLNKFTIKDDFLVTKSQMKNIISEIGSNIAPLMNRERKFLKSINVPAEIESELKISSSDIFNRIPVDFRNATTLRINAKDINGILKSIGSSSVKKVVIDQAGPDDLDKIVELSEIIKVEISLFPVQFENDIHELEELISKLEHTKIRSFEINDIGHLMLLKNSKKPVNGGPFIAPYNHVAAKFMNSLGMEKVHMPMESDIECLKGLSGSEVKLRFTLYSKIPLFYTRAQNNDIHTGDKFTDFQEISSVVNKYKDISIYYSDEYFTTNGIDLNDLNVNELIIDLSDETDIIKKFEQLKIHPEKFKGNSFNLKRRLS